MHGHNLTSSAKYEHSVKIVASEMSRDEDNKSDFEEEESGDGESLQCDSNVQWLDSITNILKTSNRKVSKPLVLSKAKKWSDVYEPKLIPAGYEVATESGEIKAEQIEKVYTNDEPVLKKRKQEILSVRTKPNVLDKDRERTLAKIATTGVVQLFNAVRAQQKDINTKMNEAGSLESKRESALKNIDKASFLNLLMGKKSQAVSEAHDTLDRSKNATTWGIFKDDYMMSAKLKDWDREVENEVEVECS